MPNGGTPQGCLHCQWSVQREKRRFFGLFKHTETFCTRHQIRLPLALFTFCPDFTMNGQPAPIISEQNITGSDMYIWMETASRPGQSHVPIYHHAYEVLAPLAVYATWTDKQISAVSRALSDHHPSA